MPFKSLSEVVLRILSDNQEYISKLEKKNRNLNNKIRHLERVNQDLTKKWLKSRTKKVGQEKIINTNGQEDPLQHVKTMKHKDKQAQDMKMSISVMKKQTQKIKKEHEDENLEQRHVSKTVRTTNKDNNRLDNSSNGLVEEINEQEIVSPRNHDLESLRKKEEKVVKKQFERSRRSELETKSVKTKHRDSTPLSTSMTLIKHRPSLPVLLTSQELNRNEMSFNLIDEINDEIMEKMSRKNSMNLADKSMNSSHKSMMNNSRSSRRNSRSKRNSTPSNRISSEYKPLKYRTELVQAPIAPDSPIKSAVETLAAAPLIMRHFSTGKEKQACFQCGKLFDKGYEIKRHEARHRVVKNKQ